MSNERVSRLRPKAKRYCHGIIKAMFRKNIIPPQEGAVEHEKPKNTAANTAAPMPTNVEPPAAPRYPKPKVLLLDLKDGSGAVLRNVGHNVHLGTLGTPFSVAKSNSYRIIPADYRVPNYAEQEIVIVDLAPNRTLEQATAQLDPIEGNCDYWAKCNSGEIDPRPLASEIFRPSFDTILAHGGIFVVFADFADGSNITYARYTGRGIDSLNSKFRLWSFLTTLMAERFEIEFQQGKEVVQAVDSSTALGRVINRHLKGARFSCVFGPLRNVGGSPYDRNPAFEAWLTLATDKYGAPVAGVIKPNRNFKGFVFILPQISNKSAFLEDFLRDVLPELVPELFPYADSKHWVEKDEYQVSEVIEIQQRILEIEEDAGKRVRELEEEISRLKEQTRYLTQLLTETGDTLVKAVQSTLESLGFLSVIDVDEEMKKTGEAGTKREDLRIVDSTTLLIEVKGITGLPTDDDALQVSKYVVVRMREWNHTNVQGLGIINHQKGVPPLGREHYKPFRDDILVNAEEQRFGLLMTWDLFRLARSFLKLGWQFEQVKPIFFSVGRIEPTPIHYEFVGIVDHFWEQVGAAGVQLESGQISKGDTLAFALPVEYEEQVVESLQVENQDVEIARAPSLLGIKTELTKQQLRKGTRVYRVTTGNVSQNNQVPSAQPASISPT